MSAESRFKPEQREVVSLEGGSLLTDEKAKRPENFEEVLKNMIQQRDQLHSPPGTWHSIEMDLREMAGGGDRHGIRSQYYLGWKNQDFSELLKKLRKKSE